MRIGFDFDNTIVNYNYLFHKVALEQELINPSVPKNKLAVRNYLRLHQQETKWTEMQGYVYGMRMNEADIYPHVLNVLMNLGKAGHTLAIISHKTKYPYLGEPYDLHAAASAWIEAKLCNQTIPLFNPTNIFFELTKDEKIARIQQFDCDIFIDDLPEILLAQQFPNKTQKFLFDPENHHQAISDSTIKRVSSWITFETYLC